MGAIDYKETELWQQAKALLIETYRLTAGWPADGLELAKDIRSLARQIVKSVPNAFKKGGITGNVHLRIAQGHFAELEALCEAAETLGFAPKGHLQPLNTQANPVAEKFRALAKAAQEQARERMVKRTDMFGHLDEEEED